MLQIVNKSWEINTRKGSQLYTTLNFATDFHLMHISNIPDMCKNSSGNLNCERSKGKQFDLLVSFSGQTQP